MYYCFVFQLHVDQQFIILFTKTKHVLATELVRLRNKKKTQEKTRAEQSYRLQLTILTEITTEPQFHKHQVSDIKSKNILFLHVILSSLTVPKPK